MKKSLFKLSILLLSTTLYLGACKQHKDKPVTPDDSGTQATSAGDQSNVSRESDEALEDANTAVSGSSNNGRLAAGASLIAGATIDSSNSSSGKYVINYNGLSQDGLRNRTGSITIQVGPTPTSKWNVAGTTITVTFTNYKVTRVSTGKSLTFNGTKVITNLGGEDWRTIVSASSGAQIVHKIRGNDLNVTFDNGTSRTWSVARHKVITKTVTNNVTDYTLTISGDTTINSYNNIESWGINRVGENFYNEIQTPVVFDLACNGTETSGVLIHHHEVDATTTKNLTITFGVNSDGSLHTSTGCPYGYKFNWIGLDGNQKQAVVSY
jgi:hypothetical protein